MCFCGHSVRLHNSSFRVPSTRGIFFSLGIQMLDSQGKMVLVPVSVSSSGTLWGYFNQLLEIFLMSSHSPISVCSCASCPWNVFLTWQHVPCSCSALPDVEGCLKGAMLRKAHHPHGSLSPQQLPYICFHWDPFPTNFVSTKLDINPPFSVNSRFP